jgi:hypothetical protein
MAAPPATAPSATAPSATATSNALRGVMEAIMAKQAQARAAHRAQLVVAQTRLQTHLAALEANPDALACKRPLEATAQKLALVERALAVVDSGRLEQEAQAQADTLLTRYLALEGVARRRKQETSALTRKAVDRFLPCGPKAALSTAPVAPVQPTLLGLPGTSSGPVSSAQGAPPGPQGTVPTADGSGPVPVQAMMPEADLATQFAQEAEIVLGTGPRQVQLLAFDVCPTCRVALRYNQSLQQLVCPTPECGHWKRFADMTSSALAYGEEMQFLKYSYRPESHLDDIMKFAEATESYVVPPEALMKVMERLRALGVTSAEDITIPMVRNACKDVRIKMDNSVQVYSRLTGRAPRRMTPFMKDQMRIMFHVAEPSFRRFAAGRTNHLSFPFTLRKYCELLGYWEMLDSLPMLRGANNITFHDNVMSRVFNAMGWSFCAPVRKERRGPTATPLHLRTPHQST